jgi:hypothetical protein
MPTLKLGKTLLNVDLKINLQIKGANPKLLINEREPDLVLVNKKI